MFEPEKIYQNIVHKMVNSEPGICEGKMMSAPAVKYNNKVFVFYFKECIGLRLGAAFDPVKFGLINYKTLSPFKTKPPIKGWFVVEKEESNLWMTLSELALNFTKTL